MKILIVIAFVAVSLANCGGDKGLHAGVVLKECDSIASNQKEEAARTIKGLSKEDAVKALASKFSIPETKAEECLK